MFRFKKPGDFYPTFLQEMSIRRYSFGMQVLCGTESVIFTKRILEDCSPQFYGMALCSVFMGALTKIKAADYYTRFFVRQQTSLRNAPKVLRAYTVVILINAVKQF